MSFERWAAVAEFVTSFGVVVTLMLLWLQMRQNNVLIRRQIRIDQQTLYNAPLLSSSALVTAQAKILRARAEPSPLLNAFQREFGFTDEEGVLWHRYLLVQYWRVAANFRYFGSTEESDVFVRMMIRQRDVQVFWEFQKTQFPQAFQEYVESIRREVAAEMEIAATTPAVRAAERS